MINKMLIIDQFLLDIVAINVKKFLIENIDKDYENITIKQNDLNKIILNEYAVAMNIDGKINFIVVMSFEESIIKHISKVFLNEEKIAENEKIEIYDSVAKEITNIVIGSSISSFGNNGKGINMATPSLTDDKKNKEYANKLIFSEDLMTKFGKLSISIIDYNTDYDEEDIEI